MTGGTGLYLRALTEGLFAGPERREEFAGAAAAERRSMEGGVAAPSAGELDAATAERIHANDTPKLIRAIEVCVAARRRCRLFSETMERDPLTGFRLLRIGLNPPRAELYERLNGAARQCSRQGWWRRRAGCSHAMAR